MASDGGLFLDFGLNLGLVQGPGFSRGLVLCLELSSLGLRWVIYILTLSRTAYATGLLMASLDEILNDEELIKWLHNREMEHQEIECLFRQLAMLANIFYKEDIKYYEN